jgi:hypothetical protein
VPHHTYKGCPHITDAEYFERVKSRVKIAENGCWLWQGFVNPGHGYADMSYRGRSTRVHRLMYKLSGRELRAGFDVCHSCDVPTCVNPDHLWQGTAKDNMRDASLKGRIALQKKTHCLRGHAFTPENTRVYSNKHGHIMRSCRECRRLRQTKGSGWTPLRKYGRERDQKRLRTQQI